MSAARFGAALAMLWAAHDVADHVVQTDHQAAEKSRDWTAMAGHVGGYTAVQVGALAALSAVTGERATWGRAVAAVAFSSISHAFLDRRWPVRRALELTGSPGFAKALTPEWFVDPGTFWSGSRKQPAIGTVRPGPVPLHGPYLADQALHHACLAVSALILAGGDR